MRFITVTLLSLLVIACGGGASGPGDQVDTNDSVDDGQNSGNTDGNSDESDTDGNTTFPNPLYLALNDTGQTWGSNFSSGNNSSCIGETISQQDCSHGRDASSNDNSDGHAGFSFTKIDSNGNKIASTEWEWDCLLDNVTGLMWEVKSTYEKSRERFTYNQASNDYVADINESELCGYSDWKLPTISQLQGIVNYDDNSWAIDTRFFDYTHLTAGYWTSNSLANNNSYSWCVEFGDGDVYPDGHNSLNAVRLVRETK